MKKEFFDDKKGKATLRIESLDDLWYISQLVDPHDFVRAKSYRKIKLSGEGEKAKVDKKPVTLTIEVKKVEFSKTSDALRINGTVVDGQDDIPSGSHHSISLEIGTEFILQKDTWFSYHKQKLEEATKHKQSPILITLLDREKVIFAITKKYGPEIVGTLQGEVQKKDDRTQSKGSFYEEVIKTMTEYKSRYKADHIILASPAFFKDDLYKKIQNQEIKKAIVLATCYSVEESAIREILQRPEVQTVLQEEQTTAQTKYVDELLKEIAQNGKAVYGFDQTKESAQTGAIKTLLVTDELIKERREAETFAELEEIMKTVDNMQGIIHIISVEHESGKKLHGLGGIAGILRY